MFDHTILQVYFRNEFIAFKDANISIANTGFLYGLGVFTGMRAHWNESKQELYIFRAKEHYQRFYNSCKLCKFEGFTKNYSEKEFTAIIKKLLKINQIKQDAYIRVSEFVDEIQIGPKFGKYKDSLMVFLYPLGDYVPTQGMKCKVSSWVRVEDNAIPARAKIHGAYVNTAFAKTEAIDAGFDEALVMDKDGHIVEGSAENFFMVRDGVLITPPANANILEGITRKTVLEIAHDLKIPVVERDIDRTEVYLADEVFLSGTGAKVSPVTQIDSYVIADGKIGSISKKIQDVYFRATKGEVKQYEQWLTAVYE
ncbi:MAG: branched-chain amino acid transaminase [bacterium]